MPELCGDLFLAYLPRLAGEVSRAGTESPSVPLPANA